MRRSGRRGSSACSKQNHWRPIFLAAFRRGGRWPPRYPRLRNDQHHPDGLSVDRDFGRGGVRVVVVVEQGTHRRARSHGAK